MWYKYSEKEMCTEIFSTAAISIYWDILPVCGNFLMLIFQCEVALDNLLEYLKSISELNSEWNFSHRASYQNPFSVSTAFNAICRKSSAASSQPQTRWEWAGHEYWEGRHCVCTGRCSVPRPCPAHAAPWQGICGS